VFNDGKTLAHAAVAFSLLYQDLYRSKSDVVTEVDVPATGSASVDGSFDIPDDFEIVDRHGVRAFVVADDHIAAYSRYIWVTL
jgi:hypothetical protein